MFLTCHVLRWITCLPACLSVLSSNCNDRCSRILSRSLYRHAHSVLAYVWRSIICRARVANRFAENRMCCHRRKQYACCSAHARAHAHSYKIACTLVICCTRVFVVISNLSHIVRFLRTYGARVNKIQVLTFAVNFAISLQTEAHTLHCLLSRWVSKKVTQKFHY